jgi:integrase
MSGLCAHCHHHAPGPKTPLWESPGKLRRRPVKVASCPDCDAWGVTARYGWICAACKHHRETDGPAADCPTCDRHAPLGVGGSCRMCHKQRHHTAQQLGILIGKLTLTEANQHGQQLFFAGMHRLAGNRWQYKKKTVPADLTLLRPATHRQLLAFEVPRDLRAAMWDRFLPPPDPLLEAAFHEFVREHARIHGWAIGKTATVQRAIRILLGIQDTPGAAIRRSDVALLTRIKHSAAVVADVLAAAGMLHEDREPTVVRWFTTITADLPAPMRAELAEWFDVMRNGNPTPPRSKPRADNTLRSQLAFALPALTRWAADHDSLKEISRADVLAVLPASGAARNAMAQALRSIFRALRARKLVFGNPMFRIHVPAPQQQIPTLPDLVRLRQALDAPDPAAALIAALLAYHAVRVHQLRDLRLTDVHDGRLHINGPGPTDQTILLAGPVRARLRTYLDHRAATWPATINPYLFVNVRSAAHTRPVNVGWAHTQLGMSCQQIRLDRIFYEAVSTGGDLRALADMFGLSIASAARYASIVDKAQPAPSAS